MKHITYKTKGTCSSIIEFDLDDEMQIHDLKFRGGCPGNLKAIGKLVEGKDAMEVANILEGNTCGPRSTSCADQLSKAIKDAVNASETTLN